MLYQPNFEKIKKKYDEYWVLENHDRPLLYITAPKDGHVEPPVVSHHATIKDRWLDTEYMIDTTNAHFRSTYFGGDALPVFYPNLGPDFFASVYGTPIEFGEDTSWALHNMHDWENHPPFHMDRECFYYKKMIEMTKAATEDARDKYLVGITDIHPGLDALVAMRSPANLCIDALECPEKLKVGAMDLFEGFKLMYEDLHAITTKYQKGSINWMRLWHPGRTYVTSCDFICMISPDMFEDLVVEELEAQLGYLDASLFHLDGPDALRHLDRLLEIKSLKGIQWVYGAGQPTAAHWIEVLKKIQSAGKAFQVDATIEDMPILLENLKPEGAHYIVNAKNEEEAHLVEKWVGVI